MSQRVSLSAIMLVFGMAGVYGKIGRTDKAGDLLTTFDDPKLPDIRNHRAVIYDSGNRRILKLEISSKQTKSMVYSGQ